jgi:hypothetical protein
MRVRGAGEGKVGERKQCAALQNADGIEVSRFDRHLRSGESSTNLDDPHSVLVGETVSLKESLDTLTVHRAGVAGRQSCSPSSFFSYYQP